MQDTGCTMQVVCGIFLYKSLWLLNPASRIKKAFSAIMHQSPKEVLHEQE